MTIMNNCLQSPGGDLFDKHQLAFEQTKKMLHRSVEMDAQLLEKYGNFSIQQIK